MSIRIIDTNILSLLQDRNEAVLRNISQYGSGELGVTIISYLERVNGWASIVNNAGTPQDKVRRYRNLVDTIELLAQFKLMTFSEEAIHRFEAFKVLKAKGKLKGFRRENDLKIAAITMDHDSIFVTQNVQHFKIIPGFVTIEDWSHWPAKIYQTSSSR